MRRKSQQETARTSANGVHLSRESNARRTPSTRLNKSSRLVHLLSLATKHFIAKRSFIRNYWLTMHSRACGSFRDVAPAFVCIDFSRAMARDQSHHRVLLPCFAHTAIL